MKPLFGNGALSSAYQVDCIFTPTVQASTASHFSKQHNACWITSSSYERYSSDAKSWLNLDRARMLRSFPRKVQVASMDITRTYRIHDLKTGQVVALIDADGTLHDMGNPQAIAELKELLQRKLIVRDRQLGFDAGKKRRNMNSSLRGVCATLA